MWKEMVLGGYPLRQEHLGSPCNIQSSKHRARQHRKVRFEEGRLSKMAFGRKKRISPGEKKTITKMS